MGDESLLQKAKRKLSTSLPKAITGSHAVMTSSSNSSASTSRAESLKPYGYRENTALHAIMDTFAGSSLTPSLPSIHLPTTCFSPNGVDDEDDFDDHSSLPTKDPLKQLSGDVLALGGYRGSILRDAKTGKRLWLPLRTGLKIRKPLLELGLHDSDEARSEESIVPGHMLMAVIGVVDLGARLKAKLKAQPQVRWHSWGYDWRRRLELSSELLIDELTKLKEESAQRGENDGKGRGTVVFAHSMGGLVALHALSQCQDPTIFRGIVFAGTPFQGTPNVLGPLRRGDGVLLNRDLCSPAVTFSMRSSFYLLPRDSRCFELPTGEPVPVDFMDPDNWPVCNFSPVATAVLGQQKTAEQRQEAAEQSQHADNVGMPSMNLEKGVERVTGTDSSEQPQATENENHEADEGEVAMPDIVFENGAGTDSPRGSGQETPPLSPINEDARTVRDYLRNTLERAKRFHQEIVDGYDEKKAHLYPPLTLLVSSKTPTVRACMTPSRQAIPDIVYEQNLLFGPGDGIVTHESASTMPEPWRRHCVGAVESSLGHLSLLGDLKSVRACLAQMQLRNA